MKDNLGFFLAISIIFFSSCTTVKFAPKNQNIPKQMIIIDSLGIEEVLPKYKGLKL